MFILLYFLLASGDLFLRKLVKVLPSLEDKKRAVEIARQIETEVSTYLSTVTFINAVLGLAVWGVMALIGVPNPLLWGVLAAVTNFIPYPGRDDHVRRARRVGFVTFNDLPHALLPPGAFLICNVLEAYVLTPMILGKRLTLNPVMIFVALSFWGWMWGIAGAVMAVPIMVVFKIFCDHSEPLAPIGEFLGHLVLLVRLPDAALSAPPIQDPHPLAPSPPPPFHHTGRGGMHARPFRAALPLLPVWGVRRGREKRAGVMRVLVGPPRYLSSPSPQRSMSRRSFLVGRPAPRSRSAGGRIMSRFMGSASGRAGLRSS